MRAGDGYGGCPWLSALGDPVAIISRWSCECALREERETMPESMILLRRQARDKLATLSELSEE